MGAGVLREMHADTRIGRCGPGVLQHGAAPNVHGVRSAVPRGVDHPHDLSRLQV